MKLFYWSEVPSLTDYWSGGCFALAETKEQAIDLIVAAYRAERGWTDGSYLRMELNSTEPIISETPIGFTYTGGG